MTKRILIPRLGDPDYDDYRDRQASQKAIEKIAPSKYVECVWCGHDVFIDTGRRSRCDRCQEAAPAGVVKRSGSDAGVVVNFRREEVSLYPVRYRFLRP